MMKRNNPIIIITFILIGITCILCTLCGIATFFFQRYWYNVSTTENKYQIDQSNFYTQNDKLYHCVRGEYGMGCEELTGFDLKQAVLINDDTIRDNNQVYQNYHILPNADPATFHILPNNEEFASDKYQVYHNANIVFGADSSTFQLLEPDYIYSKDKNSVYYMGGKMPSVDLNTFTVISSCGIYAIDKSTVYYAGEVIPTADPLTFKPISWYYSKDEKNVFYNKYIIQGADLSTFQVSGDSYESPATDKNHIYQNGVIVEQ